MSAKLSLHSSDMNRVKTRLAIVVSHPIQYYVPLYRRMACRDDLEIKVFFTWHAGQAAVPDHGFRQLVTWDIPLTQGYAYELVQNSAADPGTHHFLGLRNPSLVEQVVKWRPDAVHITGWAWLSHLLALRAFRLQGVPTLFRGDSHLLDSSRRGLPWWFKRAALERVFSWPTSFLYVGAANRAYYEAFGVEPNRLHHCPHSIDVARFSEPADALGKEAADWRRELGIKDQQLVLLFAGKFERKKRPLELMRAVQALADSSAMLIMVGAGELQDKVKALADTDPGRFRVLSFQNQSRMPVVYRLGDIFVLPSAYGETWGIAVNEAMACGRPAIVSDRVGCATDVIDASCGRVFPSTDFSAMIAAVNAVTASRDLLVQMGRAALNRAWAFDIARTEVALMDCLHKSLSP